MAIKAVPTWFTPLTDRRQQPELTCQGSYPEAQSVDLGVGGLINKKRDISSKNIPPYVQHVDPLQKQLFSFDLNTQKILSLHLVIRELLDDQNLKPH